VPDNRGPLLAFTRAAVEALVPFADQGGVVEAALEL
jgi:hypothetical protein